jgi:hypothetical protein
MNEIEATIKMLNRVGVRQYSNGEFAWDACWIISVFGRMIIFLRGENFYIRHGWRETKDLNGFEVLEALAELNPDVVKTLAEPL